MDKVRDLGLKDPVEGSSPADTSGIGCASAGGDAVTLASDVELALVLAERDYVVGKLNSLQVILERLDRLEAANADLKHVNHALQDQIATQAKGLGDVKHEQDEIKEAQSQAWQHDLGRTIAALQSLIATQAKGLGNAKHEQHDLNRIVAEVASIHSGIGRLGEMQTRAMTALTRNGGRVKLPKELRKLRRFLPNKGAKIRRAIRDYKLIAGSMLFDRDWYLGTYADISQSGVDAVLHYLRFGGKEGRSPGPDFNAQQYLAANEDVARLGMNPLLHFLRHGSGRTLFANAYPMEAGPQPMLPLAAVSRRTSRFWYYIGDTLEWLEAHPHLTGVGKVSTDLFFASRRNAQMARPCVMGQSPSRLVELTSAETLASLAQKTGYSGDAAMASSGGLGAGEPTSPQAGDHVFFTGLNWTPTFTDLFKHLSNVGISFSVIVYDIIPIESPDLVGEAYSKSFAEWLATTVGTADVIYVSSTFVKDQILRWALLSGHEVRASIEEIGFGLRTVAGVADAAALAANATTAKVDLDNFVLSVGTIDRRKNQLLLCRIWKELADRLGTDKLPQLVLVGRDDLKVSEADPAVAALFAQGKIVVLQGVSDAQVAGLYRSCLFTAFSSLSEGYGLPVAESLQYGKLCLSSSLPAIRQHAGDLIWYFSADDFSGASDLFQRAITRPDERLRAEEHLRQAYRQPQWNDTFQAMVVSAYRALFAGGGAFARGLPLPKFPGAAAIEPAAALGRAARWCTSDAPLVSILVINWNATPLTLECIRQTWAHTEGYRYEIIIADNGSDPGSLEPLRNLGDGIRVLDIGCNRFFGEANNIAAEAANGRYIFMLNNDAFVQPGWLAALIEPLLTDPTIGATGPLFLFPDGAVQEAGGSIDEKGYPIRFGRGDKEASAATLTPKVVDYISAAALLMPREVFMEAGGYDLAYEPAYYEDADLCLKIQAFGRKVRYCPDAKVIHIEGAASNGDTAAMARRKALGDLNRDKFVSRWGGFLRTRDPQELVALRQALSPRDHIDPPLAPEHAGRTAVVYTPYQLTPGGGERYLLTLATVLARQHVVTVVTPHMYSVLRLRNLGQEFGVDLSRLHVTTHADFMAGPAPDLMVTMGNHALPPIAGRGATNIFVCQFPFRMSETPSAEQRALLSGYRTIAVYSQYAATHVRKALDSLKLPLPNIRIVYPPVPQMAGDFRRKKRMILTVGRFFVGGHSKRHDALITAFKSICRQFSEPVEFHLAGSSLPASQHMDYLASLKASAEGYPIHFHVNCSPEDLDCLYRDAAVYWHGTGIDADLAEEPGRAEHFGISLVEAMSAQAIPFALNVGGPTEIITNGETGFLYDSLETLSRLTLEVFSPSHRERAERIMQAAGVRAGDFSSEKFERDIEALAREAT